MMKQSIKFFISILFLFLLIFIPAEESFSQMPPPPGFKLKPDIDTSIYKYKWLDVMQYNKTRRCYGTQ